MGERVHPHHIVFVAVLLSHSPVRLRHAVLAWLPNMVSHGLATIMVALSRCTRSSSINSSTAILAFRSLGLPLHYLWSMYNVSGTFDSPDSALTCLNDLVGPPGITDTSRFHCNSSSATWQIWMGVRLSVVVGRWCGQSRYIPCCVQHCPF